MDTSLFIIALDLLITGNYLIVNDNSIFVYISLLAKPFIHSLMTFLWIEELNLLEIRMFSLYYIFDEKEKRKNNIL
jgi:hypothetical protein